MKRFILAITTLISCSINAQTGSETVSVMYYNLLKFPNTTLDRVDTLEKIIRYVEPDLFLVCELESSYGATQILANAMNTQGVTHYSKAIFYDGNDTDNMLFYNDEKFGLVGQHQISGGTRDISEYKIYYKEPGLDANSDTTYLYLYCAHLKAGSTQSDANTRASEATNFKNYLQNAGRTGNLIFGGDFNLYESSEAACQTLLTGGNVAFNDPVNQLGSWHNNSTYAAYHTQSSRSQSGGYAGGSSGGMDDRFDFILISDEVKNGTDRVQYVGGSYKAIGQDGNRLNSAVNTGFNYVVPADIADALFYMSDHLPVFMEMSIEYPVGVQEVQSVLSNFHFINEDEMQLILNQGVSLLNTEVYSLAGQRVLVNQSSETLLDLSDLSKGVYVLKLNTNKGMATAKFFKE
ncbi:T9SS type A sorting domain-containing protein [Parvicella tangerina]|uniref:T9SS C-terminal target domain-containing protein n=1 Tax=Parvicella tangerina TaxID=2829795 RepID=A0A916JKT6_9FLAO|nr:T9SS type A sorting domain-containing protein [Parvicella tangerina]CAG5078902.1 hypothetical protein CRYO30217_00802 [Parvicella tangerina]